MKDEVLIRQIDGLINSCEDLCNSMPGDPTRELGSQILTGTMGLFCWVYGEASQQVSILNQAKPVTRPYMDSQIKEMGASIRGMLYNLKSEIECGLLGSLRMQLAGGVLGDFVLLAREALLEQTSFSKNVAAVLAAAAFEDTIRRMGSEFAGINDRPKLADVINTLKEKEILKGSQVGIAQSFLNFRNNALHADWDKIEKASIESVLGFVQELLSKHFG